MLSYYEPTFDMTQNKNQLFGRHLEIVQHLFYFILFYFILSFCRIMIFYSANFIAKFHWESGFLRLGP